MTVTKAGLVFFDVKVTIFLLVTVIQIATRRIVLKDIKN